MNNYSFTKDGVTYKRINKTAARAAYNRGETVYIMPVNANPHFFIEWVINTADPAGVEYRETSKVMTYSRPEFDTRVMYFEIYNCVNELGNYAAYYIAVA